MRSIGRRNRKLVDEIIMNELNKGHSLLEQRIMDSIPKKVLDSWEGAYVEIQGIIDDTLIKKAYE